VDQSQGHSKDLQGDPYLLNRLKYHNHIWGQDQDYGRGRYKVEIFESVIAASEGIQCWSIICIVSNKEQFHLHQI